MGRRVQGTTKREKLVAIRMNDEEHAEMERNRTRRNLDTSAYFRTLVKEDSNG